MAVPLRSAAAAPYAWRGPWDDKKRALVVIETPKGSPNKLKFDAVLGCFRLTKVLPTGMVFPYDFGFLPGTRAADGDPLDVLVLMDAPVFPGCVVPSRVIGILEAEQRRERRWLRNDRIIAVAEEAPTQRGIKRLGDVDATLLADLEAFFGDYNRIAGRGFRVLRRRGPRTAVRLVERAR
jgi:inorganic pyrophosphatase